MSIAGCDFGKPDPGLEVTSDRGLKDAVDPKAPRLGVITLHAGFAPDPKTLRGETNTARSAETLHRRCDGFVSQQPDLVVDAETSFLKLNVMVRTEKDSMMLAIKDSNGQITCSRFDSSKHGALLADRFGAGKNEIYIGTRQNNQRIPFTIGFSELEWRIDRLPPPSALPSAGATP